MSGQISGDLFLVSRLFFRFRVVSSSFPRNSSLDCEGELRNYSLLLERSPDAMIRFPSSQTVLSFLQSVCPPFTYILKA